MSRKRLLYVIFAAAIGLRLFFVFATPDRTWNATGNIHPLNDEYSHFKFIRYLIEHHSLPVNTHIHTLEEQATWIFQDFEYFQAPLYYILNIPFAKLPEPMVMCRLLSVLLSGITLWLAIKCARLCFLDQQQAATVTLVLMGFHPIFVRVGSCISNDNLCWLIAMILFYLILRGIGPKHWLIWGIILGLGLLTKASFITWLSVPFIVSYFQEKDFRGQLPDCLRIVLIAVAMSGWWFVRNHLVYGDWSGMTGGAGRPEAFLSSGSVYLMHKFFHECVRYAFFPIAEERFHYFSVANAIILLLITSFFLFYSRIPEMFRKPRAFFVFLSFNVIVLLMFLYANLHFLLYDPRYLLIALFSFGAIAISILMMLFGRAAPIAALLINAIYFVSLCH